MKKQKNAYDFKKESRIFALVMLVVLMLIMTVGVMEICGVFCRPEEPIWKPTEVYPMTNAHIVGTSHFDLVAGTSKCLLNDGIYGMGKDGS